MTTHSLGFLTGTGNLAIFRRTAMARSENNFAFLAFQRMEELDLVGPWEMATGLRYLNLVNDAFVVGETRNPVVCANGLLIKPNYTFEDCPPFKLLLVPGGDGRRREVNNRTFMSFLKQRGAKCEVLLSVCTGVFLLHAAGFMTGRKATTHWHALDELKELGDVDVVQKRYVRDGKVWTAAGVASGIDMMLAFMAHRYGENVSELVQFYTEYYPEPTIYGNPQDRPDAPDYLKERS